MKWLQDNIIYDTDLAVEICRNEFADEELCGERKVVLYQQSGVYFFVDLALRYNGDVYEALRLPHSDEQVKQFIFRNAENKLSDHFPMVRLAGRLF